MGIKSQLVIVSILLLLVILTSFDLTVGEQQNYQLSTNQRIHEPVEIAHESEEEIHFNQDQEYEVEQEDYDRQGTAPSIDEAEDTTSTTSNFGKQEVVELPSPDSIPTITSQHYETKLEVVEQLEPAKTEIENEPEVDIESEGHGAEDDQKESKVEPEKPLKSYKDDSRPNIILIMTDDQDIELGSMDYMPNTLKIFRDNGLEFRHGYVSTPMCCPSRSSLLTGVYVHNHDVYTNNDNCSSVAWREKYEKKTFAAHLYSSGYYTSYIGKYLNKYNGDHIPYGYDEWNGLLMNSRFYNYTVNRNGRRVRHGNDYLNDYYPDLIANDTLDFLSRVGSNEMKRPFLLVSSFPSPHGPEDSAPQYSEMFMNSTPHHTPSYNHAPNLDKQWILRRTNEMTPILKQFTNLLMTKRLQSLQSVDTAVQAIFDKLHSTGLDKNTYVFYTSDHGYHVGQFGLVKGKSMPYEFDIRVPFFLYGPSSIVKGGTQVLEPVLNIDLAPTFLDIAEVPIPPEMDGRSILPLIKQYSPSHPKDPNFEWKDVFLIESSGRRETPHEATALPATSSSKKSKKQREDRRKPTFEDNETLRANNLCVLHPHPCIPGQKKYCRKDKDRVQFKKCRHFDFVGGGSSSYSPLNDPLYPVSLNGSNINEHQVFPPLNKKCRCRFRRSRNSSQIPIDWEIERKKIDDEIESLKKRIEDLRNRRKDIRRKWLMENSPIRHNKDERRGRQHEEPEFEGIVPDDDEIEKDDDAFKGESDSDLLHKSSNHSSTSGDRSGDETGSDIYRTETDKSVHSSEEHETAAEDEEFEDGHDEDDAHTSAPSSLPTERSPTLTTDPEEYTTTHLPTTETSRSKYHEEVQEYSEAKFEVKQPTQRKKEAFEQEEDELGLDFEGDFASFANFNNHHQRKRNRNRFREKNHNRSKKYPDLLEIEGYETYEGEDQNKCDCSHDPRWVRQKEREDRKRKKLLSKLRKKQKYMKRIVDPEVRKQAETCGTEEKMNCFWHDNDHWKTPPLWDSGSFCFCMNANNNTYSCLRSVNSTHNYLYCQFITGFKMYFDLRKDPYQLTNVIGTLPAAHEDWMLVQLLRLKKCKGREECWAENENQEEAIQSSIWEQIFGRWPKKRRRGNGNKRRQY